MTAVATFYRFVELHDLERLRAEIEVEAGALELKGTVLIAAEGINGTLSGEAARLETFAAGLQRRSPFAGLEIKYSAAAEGNPVFYRLKVRIRPEIVTLGRPESNPARRTGKHVDAAAWNELLRDPDVLVIDTRNRYEVAIGSFPGAVDPGTTSFREFPDYVAGHLDPARHTRVAMFCTGGIRCEKASAYLLEQGFQAVYQLDGGVLKYLETVAEQDNAWQGECFVFDQRVSVDAALEEGSYEQCFACRHPLGPEDLASAEYRQGISCPYCSGALEAERLAALEERQRQVTIAASRGDRHVGKQMG